MRKFKQFTAKTIACCLSVAGLVAFSSVASAQTTSSSAVSAGATSKADPKPAPSPTPNLAQKLNSAVDIFNQKVPGASAAGGNTNENAKQGGAAQLMTMLPTLAMGAYAASQCDPKSPFMCAIALANFAQLGNLGGAAKGAGQTAGATSLGGGANLDPNLFNFDPKTADTNCVGAFCLGDLDSTKCLFPPCPNGKNPDDVKTTLDKVNDDVKKVVADLKKAGVTADKTGDKLILPDGKTISISSLGTPEGLKAAGFGSAEMAAMAALQEKAVAASAEKVRTLAKAMGSSGDSGGGGISGGYGPGYADGSGGGGGSIRYDGEGGAGKNKKTAGIAVTGLKKKLGNEEIGVAGDNIWEMVSRQYQKNSKAQTFLNEQGTPAGMSGAAPGSAGKIPLGGLPVLQMPPSNAPAGATTGQDRK